jgi:vancomycin resistance protein YoaR
MSLLRTPEAKRFAALVALFVASGAVVTWLLLPPPEDPAALLPPSVRVAGAVLAPAGDLAASAIDGVRRYASGEIALVLPDGSRRKVRRSTFGVQIDRVRLAEFVNETQKPDSALRRAYQASEGGQKRAPIDVPLPLALDDSVALPRLMDLKAELDASATDAYVDLASKQLRTEKAGYRVDVYATLARLEAALRTGAESVEVAVEKVAPKLLASALGNVKFDQVLGYFETRYSQAGKGKDRTYNLRQAASKLDGAVVMPLETFDFNAVVGPRDEAHGYRIAPVIAQGELVDGLGGGTCQISGTLHGAALFAGLDIVERYPHSRPSYYIKLGLDATVVYPTINFRFRNPFDFPIVLHETVADGVVRAEILGPTRERTVTFFRRIDEVVPFEEVERPTPKLHRSVRVLAQRGIPGFKMTSSRVVREGAYAVRTKWSDTYPPTAQIVNVGTGTPDTAVEGHDDAHPEFVVDEVLVVTQGPDIRTPGATEAEPGGGTVESREPGRTGTYGWTERAGMRVFSTKERDDDVTVAEGKALHGEAREKNREGKPPADTESDGKKSKKRRKKKREAGDR